MLKQDVWECKKQFLNVEHYRICLKTWRSARKDDVNPFINPEW